MGRKTIPNVSVTLFLDLAVNHVYAPFNKIDPLKANTTLYQENKRIFARYLVSHLVADTEKRQKISEKADTVIPLVSCNWVIGWTTRIIHIRCWKTRIYKKKFAFCVCFTRRKTKMQMRNMPQNYEICMHITSIVKDLVPISLQLFIMKEH